MTIDIWMTEESSNSFLLALVTTLLTTSAALCSSVFLSADEWDSGSRDVHSQVSDISIFRISIVLFCDPNLLFLC